MDQARILSRLCIDHKHSHRWKMGKVFPFSRLRGLLSNALNACSPLDSSTTQGDALIRMNEIELLHADISRRVGKDKSQEPMHASMVKLLKLCNSLTAQVYSKSGLHQKTYIEDQMAFEKFKKLGRYCSISQDLTKAARSSRYEVFDHIKVEVVKICPSWSVKPKSPVSLTASLESACGPAKAQTAKDLVKSYVQNPSGKDTYHQKQAELNQELSRAPKSWKVHAEIQLLLHYELHPSLQKPRVGLNPSSQVPFVVTLAPSIRKCYLRAALLLKASSNRFAGDILQQGRLLPLQSIRQDAQHLSHPQNTRQTLRHVVLSRPQGETRARSQPWPEIASQA